MMSVFEHLRRHLHVAAGIEKANPWAEYEALRNSEWSPEFEERMRARLIMGAMRYGLLAEGSNRYDRVAGIRRRLRQYEETGNLECLVDAANLALVEYVKGQHPTRHFSAKDGDHSCS